MAWEINIVPRTMSRIIKQELGLSNDKHHNALLLHLKKIEKKKSRLLLYNKEHYKEILFTDEKKFTVEETLYKQNDRVYARSYKEARKLVLRIDPLQFGGTASLLYIFVKSALKQWR
jgi:hypothetical protein